MCGIGNNVIAIQYSRNKEYRSQLTREWVLLCVRQQLAYFLGKSPWPHPPPPSQNLCSCEQQTHKEYIKTSKIQ